MDSIEKPYYGYRILPFITFVLIGSGAIGA